MKVSVSCAPLLLLVIAGTALGACHHGDDAGIELPPVFESAPPDVGVAHIERRALDATFQAMGTVEPARAVDVGSPTLARIEQVYVTEGDVVEAGTELVALDTTVARLQVAQARANVASARVQLDQVVGELERYAPLVERGVVSQQQVDQLASQRDALRESVEAAEATVSVARSQVDDGDVLAPFAGTVTELSAEIGAMASPGASLVRIVDMSAVDVRIRVPEADLPNVRVGQSLTVSVPSLGVEREGTVRFVDPELDAQARTGEALVRVDNADGRLFAGAFAEVTVPRENATQALVVPADGVVRTGDGAAVVIPRGTGFERRPVVAVALPDGLWAVTGDLNEGDAIAVGELARLRIDEVATAAEETAP